jgi:uncharacterized membrane protein
VVRKIKSKIRNIFLAGLVAIIPIAFTLFLLTWIFKKLDKLSPAVTDLLILLGAPIPHGFKIPGIGIVATILVIFFVGILIKSVVGKELMALGEYFLDKIPFIRSVYNGIKQILEGIAISNKNAFKQVVMIEYPRKGLYSLGFLTCDSKGEIQEKTDKDIVNVFIPTTPNPTSGFLLLVPKEDIIPLSMTAEEAIKLIVSGGIVTPLYKKDIGQQNIIAYLENNKV